MMRVTRAKSSPVSYTHLDVYKRQVIANPTLAVNHDSSETGHIIFIGTLGPVSYTHLDVYKRQTLSTTMPAAAINITATTAIVTLLFSPV